MLKSLKNIFHHVTVAEENKHSVPIGSYPVKDLARDLEDETLPKEDEENFEALFATDGWEQIFE